MKDRVTERGDREIFHLMIHSSDCHHSQGWTRHQELHLGLPRGCRGFSRELDEREREQLGHEWALIEAACVPGGGLTCYTTIPALEASFLVKQGSVTLGWPSSATIIIGWWLCLPTSLEDKRAAQGTLSHPGVRREVPASSFCPSFPSHDMGAWQSGSMKNASLGYAPCCWDLL